MCERGGRAQKQKMPDTVTASEAAGLLGINKQKIRTLIKGGMLKERALKKRQVYVSRESVENLLSMLNDPGMIAVKLAARQFNLSTKSFESLWVKRGVIAVRDIIFWRQVSIGDLENLRSKLKGKVTATEAGQMIAMHRSHFANLERRGMVSSEMLGARGGVKLYSVADVENFISR